MSLNKDWENMSLILSLLENIVFSGNHLIFNIDVDEMLKDVNQSIVQDHIANPLIINGHKFEMGLYVLMPSIDPLMSYIYKDGLARFATESHNTNSLDITSTFYILRMQK